METKSVLFKHFSKVQVKHNSNYAKDALNPFWVTGLCDAEGSFSMSIVKSKTTKVGWTIQPSFSMTLHIRDLELLNSVKNFFSVGAISIYKNTAQYRVRYKEELKVVIKHFNEYPLYTSKSINFLYFCEILNLMDQKQHTNVTGFLMLASLINKLNNPLSESLLAKLLELGPVPNVELKVNNDINKIKELNPFWLSGFITGEGSFTYFTRSRINSAGSTVKDYTLVFEISQRTIDVHILKMINSFFKEGNVFTDTKRSISRYRLTINVKTISILSSHFKDYLVLGHKAEQWFAWLNLVHYLINNKNKTDQDQNVLEGLILEISKLS